MSQLRRSRASGLLALILLLPFACNLILENDGYLVYEDAGAGGNQGGASGQTSGGQTSGGQAGDDSSSNSGAAGAAGEASGCAAVPGCGVCDSAGGAAGADCGAPPCPSCTIPHGIGVCGQGQCGVASCAPGWRDANGLGEDGCESGDVPAGMALWFMADRGLIKNGDLVSTWEDQSLNGEHGTQSNAQFMPKYVTQPSGPAMIEFDGVDDYFKLPSGFTNFPGLTFFAVAESLPRDKCAGILHFSNGPDRDDVEFGRHKDHTLYYEVVDSYLYGSMEGFVADKRLLVSIMQDTQGAVELRIDTAVNQTGKVSVPASVLRSQNFLGKDNYDECSPFRGRIGEVLLYSRAVTAPEREHIQSYLLSKWGIAAR